MSLERGIYMYYLNNYDLIKIEGGLSISGTLINSFSRAITTILDLGRSLGTAIRRVYSNNFCKL